MNIERVDSGDYNTLEANKSKLKLKELYGTLKIVGDENVVGIHHFHGIILIDGSRNKINTIRGGDPEKRVVQKRGGQNFLNGREIQVQTDAYPPLRNDNNSRNVLSNQAQAFPDRNGSSNQFIHDELRNQHPSRSNFNPFDEPNNSEQANQRDQINPAEAINQVHRGSNVGSFESPDRQTNHDQHLHDFYQQRSSTGRCTCGNRPQPLAHICPHQPARQEHICTNPPYNHNHNAYQGQILVDHHHHFAPSHQLAPPVFQRYEGYQANPETTAILTSLANETNSFMQRTMRLFENPGGLGMAHMQQQQYLTSVMNNRQQTTAGIEIEKVKKLEKPIERECTICQEQVMKGEAGSCYLECTVDTYHQECIMAWLKGGRDTCPSCKTPTKFVFLYE